MESSCPRRRPGDDDHLIRNACQCVPVNVTVFDAAAATTSGGEGVMPKHVTVSHLAWVLGGNANTFRANDLSDSRLGTA